MLSQLSYIPVYVVMKPISYHFAARDLFTEDGVWAPPQKLDIFNRTLTKTSMSPRVMPVAEATN